MRSLSDRLHDILRAVETIEETAREGRERFYGDKYRQVWVIYHLQIIGEAARPISARLCKICPEYPWVRVIGMRNILVHSYFGVDLDTVGPSWNKICPT